FAPLSPNQNVPLTFGQQQGFHVWTNLRARNLCFEQVTFKRTATAVATGQILSTSQEQLPLVPAQDPALAQAGWGQLPTSVPTFLCPNPGGYSIPHQQIELRVDIQDQMGRMATAKQTVVPFCPMTSIQATCERQCSPAQDAGTDAQDAGTD